MNTRRISALILSLLMVICITVGLSACEPTCNHQWKDATCTEPKTCTVCKETDGDPLGHTIVKDKAVDPTCTVDGLTEGSHCSTCKEVVKKQEVVPAKGHAFGDWYISTDATCDNKGVERRDCSCGHFETREIDAKEHSYEAVVTAPTCTEQGYTTHTCACGDSYVDSYVDALDHAWDEGKVTTEATCVEDGVLTKTCKNGCGESKEEVIPATGHSHKATVTAPTCTEQGYTTHTCACGDSYVDTYVAALSHSFDEGKVTTEATCEKDGVLIKTCKNGCGETKEEVIPATGHSHKATVTAPTCTEQGYTTHTCACGDEYVDTYVDPLGHTWGAWEKIADSEEDDGSHIRHCSVCNESETKPHEYSTVVTKPTCTEQGYTTYTCGCGYVKVDDYVRATDHAWDNGTVETQPGCESTGVLIKTCENGCGETKPEIIPANGHSYKATVTAPTCTKQGYTTYTCACGDTYDADHVSATGHSYSKVVTAPTCTEEGYTTYTCSASGCGHTYTDDKVDALGHTGGEANCTSGPICSVCGVEYGAANGHEMVEATCTAAAYCENCDHTEGEALGHTGGTATCTALAICERCNKEYGSLAEHEMVEADCNAPAHCVNCDHKVGTALGHTGGTATCTALAVCERCGDEYGSRLPHEYTVTSTEERYLSASATCTEAAVYCYSCACGEKGSETFTYGEPLGHSYNTWTSNGDNTHSHTCSRCDDVETEACSGGAATCTLAAVCDACKEYYGSALGHSYDEGKVTAPATCTTAGTKTFTCSCGATTTDSITATGHSYKDTKVDPTCTARGYTTHECTNSGCGHSYTDSYVDAKGHSFGKWYEVTPATCVATGLEKRDCSVCGGSETKVIAALGHDLVHDIKDPTCTEKGYTTHTCENCDYRSIDSYVNETGHSYTESVVAPTCTTKGYTTYTCGCGYTYDGNYKDALDHSYGDWYESVPATCTATGTNRRDCKNCNHFETESIAATGHTYATSVTAPTCTAKGYTTYTCGCGDTYVANYTDAKGHSYVSTVKNPTCTETGYTTYVCSVCNDSYVSDYKNAAGHTYATSVTAPTCVAKGYTTYTCNCGDTYVADYTDAKGHSWNIAAPTCTEDQICSACGETNEAKGHSIYLASTTPATCQAAAVNHYKCHNCDGYSLDEKVGTPISHNITGVTATLVLKEGETCVYVEEYTCVDCGATVIGKEVTKHEKYTAAITTAATCVTEGIKTLTCADCGYEKTEKIGVDTELGHNWDEGVLDEATKTRTFTCQHEGCGATKSVYDASAETSADVSSDDLKNEIALKDANLNFGEAGVNQDVTIGADTLTDEDKANLGIGNEALEQVGDNPIYNFTMTSGDTTITQFDGYVIITLPYELAEGEDVDSIAVWYIEGDQLVEIKATYNNGYVTFKTNHFSYYTVTRLTPAQRCKLYGHNFADMVVDPTCTEQGYTLHSCIRCNHTEKDKFVDPLNHNYISAIKTPAGCTTSGVELHVCANCADSYEVEIAPRGHVYDDGVVTVPVTCTTAGVITYTCDCGNTRTEAIPTEGHNYNYNVTKTDPTCTEKGYTTYTCHCGDTFVSDYIDAKGHTFGDWYVHVAPTCTMMGLNRRDCVCGHFETTLIDAIGHSYNTKVTDPTCTEQGYTTYTCKNAGCNDSYVGNFVPANGHSHKATVTAPTCISKGYTTYTCDCGNTYVADYTPTSSHSFNSVKTDPTCISKGYTTHTCQVEGCGYTYMDSFTDASDHIYGSWTTVNAATCEGSGLERRDCDHCDHYESNILSAIGHSYSAVETKPTCTEQGYTTYRCTNDGCGSVYTDNYVSAKGHSYESVVTKSTCDESGYTTHTCSCGDEYTDSYVAPTGHDYVAEWTWDSDYLHAWINIKCNNSGCQYHDAPYAEYVEAEVISFESTCDKPGRDEYLVHFEFGGKSFSDKKEIERAMLGHNFHDEYQYNKFTHWFKCSGCKGNSGKIPHEFDEGTVTRTPNCIREGEITFKCVCGYTYTETLPKSESHTAGKEVYHDADAHWNVCTYCGDACNVTAHEWDEGRVVKSANCTEEGIMEYRCSCNEIKTEAIPTNNNHSYKDDLTYDENGHWGECSRCGDGNGVAAHEFGAWKTVKPASCTEEGTKQHKCACGYVETDVIPMVEHTYIAKTNDAEHWNECRVCGTKSDVEAHAYETEIKLVLPTCISEGVRTTACSCGHWNVEILPITDVHDYSVPAFDENGHWTECKLCGDRTDEEAHSYDEENATTTKAPTCIREGLAELECVCGHNITVTLEPTGIHEFVDGSCKHCGQPEIECNHEISRFDKIDLSEIGCCDGYIEYYSCDCGKQSGIVGSLAGIGCENLFESDMVYDEDENGNLCVTAYVECLDCGLLIDLYAVAIEDGCVTTVTYRYTFADKDGKVFLELNETLEDAYHENQKTTTAGIADKTCGTDIEIDVCADCGTLLSINGFTDTYCCEMFENEPEYELDENENPISVTISASCSKCGLTIAIKHGIKYFDSCNYEEYVRYEVYARGELALEYSDSSITRDHNYETTYELLGESCADGVKVTSVCTKCGDTYVYEQDGHVLKYEEFNTSDFGMCNGYGHIETCGACNEVINVSVHYTDCWFDLVSVDESGLEIWRCQYCGVERHSSHTYSEKDETCNVVVDVVERYYLNGELVLDASHIEYYVEHNNKETYELLGETCGDGYIVYVTCLDCGYSHDYSGYEHMVNCEEFDLGELGFCGGTGSKEICWVCKELVRTTLYWVDCVFNVVSHDEETNTTYCHCDACGIDVYVTDTASEKDEWCRYELNRVSRYYKGDELILEIAYVEYIQEHNYEATFVMHGESCNDGYEVIYTCSGCGHTVSEYRTDHATFKIYEADFENSGSCKHHYVYVMGCPCGEEINNIELDYENLAPFQETDEETYSKQGYICEDCGYSVIVTQTVQMNGCAYTQTMDLTVTIDGVVDYNYNMSYSEAYHDVKVTYTPKADGSFIVSNACAVCGEGTVTESQVVTITYNEELGCYSYDLYFTPDEKGVYYIYSVCETDVDVVLYELLDDGTLNYLGESGNRYWMNFGCKKTLTAGKTYVYRIFSDSANRNTVVPYVLTMVDKSFDPKHASFYYYEAIPENYVPCRDNTYAVYLCGCGCGYVGHVEIFGVEGKHEYNEEGFCQYCGTECTHEANKLTYINLADYGFCGGIVVYYTCDCGVYSFYDVYNEMIEMLCENTVTDDNSGVNEDGTMWRKQTIECLDCGMYAELCMTANQCYHITGEMVFYTCKGGEAVKTLVVDYNGNEHAETEIIGLGLGDRVCGGDFNIQICKICGETVFIGEPTLTCNLIEEELGYTYVENGVEYSVRTYCVDCGLEVIMTQYQYNVNCIVTQGYKFNVYIGDELVYELDMVVGKDANHNWHTYYDYVSDKCSDGVIAHIGCYGCGFEAQCVVYDHVEIYHASIDASEYGFCSGSLNAKMCEHCGEIVGIHDVDLYGCSWELVGTDEATGAEIYTCNNCGAVRHSGRFETEKDENCKVYITKINKYYVNGELVFDLSNEYYNIAHNIEERYEFNGGSCEDGYKVIYTCLDCGYTGESYRTGHNTTQEYIDWVELGVTCGGYAYRNVCQICGEQTYSYGYTHCSYAETGVDEATGAVIYTCVNCGSVKRVTREIEYTGTCSYINRVIYEYIVGDTVVFTEVDSSHYETHQWVYEFIFDDPSNPDCESGVTVNYYCSACGEKHSEHTTGHNAYRRFTADFASLGCCTDRHRFYYSVCPCGEYYDYNIGGGLSSYDGQNYFCHDCGYTVTVADSEVVDGCTVNMVNSITMYVDGVEIYSFSVSRARIKHDFVISATLADDGKYQITMVCKNCMTVVNSGASASEYHTVTLENHNGYYYYDFAFIPTESGSYTIMSNTSGDTYVELYRVVDGMYEKIGSDDDGANYNNNFKLTKHLEAGTEYVYRIRYYGNGNKGDISFTLGMAVETEGDPNCKYHNNYGYETVQVLASGATSCEDGAFVIRMCSCGKIDSVSVSTEHNINYTETIDFSEYGADGGRAEIYSCACGEYGYVSVDFCNHGYNGNSNEYTDEDGIRWYVDSWWTVGCDCNIRYDRKYYITYNPENCTRVVHYVETLSVGGNLIADCRRDATEVWHDDEISYTLRGKTCGDGVDAISTCRNCGRTENNYWYWCKSMEIERIYIEELGSVCGGYVSIYSCACGNSFDFRVSGAECHFDRKWTNDFVEGDLDTYQYTAEGYNDFYTDSYVYTCSVTHPEQCGFAIRYSWYWKKNADCSATKYLTMQFGYDEETGTYASERTIELQTRTYHNYEYSSIDGGEKYTCPDCGSYYSYVNEFNENGYQTKHTKIYVNTLDDGCTKYRERVVEYLGEEFANYYNPEISDYEKYVYADGSEWWYIYEYTYTLLDEAPYGDVAWMITYNYVNSNGETSSEECGYFIYEGYSFTMYEYHVDTSGYWYRYDYAYDFTDGCMRTRTYTNSNGEYSVSGPSSAHPSSWHKTIKEPTCTQLGVEGYWCPVCEHVWNESYTSPTEHNWVMLNNGLYYCYDCGLQNINGATGDIVMEDLTNQYGNGEAYVIGYYLKSNHQFTPWVLINLHEPVVIDGEENYVLIFDLTDDQIHFVEDPYVGIYVTLADINAAVAAINDAYGLALTSDMYDVTITLVPDGADSLFDYAITFADLEGADEIDYVIKNTEFLVEYVAEGNTQTFTICPETSGYWDIEVMSYNYGGWLYIYDSNGNMMHGSSAGHHTNRIYFVAGETYTVEYTMWSWSYECYVAFSFTQVTFEEPVTLYYYNDNWSKVNVYLWNWNPETGETKEYYGWPGFTMTPVDGMDGWYYIDLACDYNYLNLIFTDANGMQTIDLAYNGNVWWVGEVGYATYEEALVAIEEQENAIPEWYLAGSFNDWSASDPLVYDENGVASIEVTLHVGDQFKIADVVHGWQPQLNANHLSDDAYAYFSRAEYDYNIYVNMSGYYRLSVVDGALVVELLK